MTSFWDSFGDDEDEAAGKPGKPGEHHEIELWQDAEEPTAVAPSEPSAPAPAPAAATPQRPDAVDAELADDATPDSRKKKKTGPAGPSGPNGNRRKLIIGGGLIALALLGLVVGLRGGSTSSSQGTTVATSVNNPTTTYGVSIVTQTTTSQTGTATTGGYQSEARAVVGQAARFLRRFDRLHGGLPGSDAKLKKMLEAAVGVPVATTGSAPGVLVFTRIQARNSVLLIMTDPQTHVPAISNVQLPR